MYYCSNPTIQSKYGDLSFQNGTQANVVIILELSINKKNKNKNKKTFNEKNILECLEN
jgi:hypothetical protein